jgi:hypothetical protein
MPLKEAPRSTEVLGDIDVVLILLCCAAMDNGGGTPNPERLSERKRVSLHTHPHAPSPVV